MSYFRPPSLGSPPALGTALIRLVLVVLSLACSPSPDASTPSRGDIILITVDTLRADHLGLYGYPRATSPFLDRFFSDGTLIERAYATEANTSPSVVSILSGLLPQDHRVRLLYQLMPDDLSLISDLLPEHYQSAGFVANVVLTDEAIGLARHFDYFDDFIGQNVGAGGAVLYERDARKTTDAALTWLKTERDPSRPLFLWVHYIDPHAPYRAPEALPRTFTHDDPRPIDTGRLAGTVRVEGETDGLYYVDRYDEEIAFTDQQVERLLTGYGAHRDLDSALVIFTADHGESMMEHEMWFAHGYQVYDEIVRVPLMLRGPGVQSTRLRVLGSGIDVAPTILAFADAPIPSQMNGIDLRQIEPGADDRTIFSEATSPLGLLFRLGEKGQVGYWRAMIQGDQKWVAGMVRGARDVREWRQYDLANDPGEAAPESPSTTHDIAPPLQALIQSDPDPGGLPEALRGGIKIDAPKVAPRASEAQRKQLRALGYVED